MCACVRACVSAVIACAGARTPLPHCPHSQLSIFQILPWQPCSPACPRCPTLALLLLWFDVFFFSFPSLPGPLAFFFLSAHFIVLSRRCRCLSFFLYTSKPRRWPPGIEVPHSLINNGGDFFQIFFPFEPSVRRRFEG